MIAVVSVAPAGMGAMMVAVAVSGVKLPWVYDSVPVPSGAGEGERGGGITGVNVITFPLLAPARCRCRQPGEQVYLDVGADGGGDVGGQRGGTSGVAGRATYVTAASFTVVIRRPRRDGPGDRRLAGRGKRVAPLT